MSAWDIYVLHNDTALDAISLISDSDDVKATVGDLLESKYIDVALLAVAIVDASLNEADLSILGSFFEYEDWFRLIEKDPMTDLKEKALKTLTYIKDNDYYWEKDSDMRKQMLDRIEARLNSNAKESKSNAKYMIKDVKISLDIGKAKKMLAIAGFSDLSSLSDDEVFDKVLDRIKNYGVTIL